MSAPPSLLDEVLPRFDASEVHDVWVAAPPNIGFAAVKQMTVREVRLLVPLEALRGLRSLLAARPAFRPAHSAPVLDEFTVGVVPLGERPGAEIAAGAVGRFWRFGRQRAGGGGAHARGLPLVCRARVPESGDRVPRASRARR